MEQRTAERTLTFDAKAAVVAGLVSGAVFLVLEMIMVPLFLGDPAWAPPRMIAAIVMGEGVLPPPATFDLMIILVAMMVHFVLSVLFALVLGFLIYRLQEGMALAVGAGYGLALYFINFYLLTAVFPWFAMARNWVSIFAHIVFGLVAAWMYIRQARVRTV